jgi:hypothetical protein
MRFDLAFSVPAILFVFSNRMAPAGPVLTTVPAPKTLFLSDYILTRLPSRGGNLFKLASQSPMPDRTLDIGEPVPGSGVPGQENQRGAFGAVSMTGKRPAAAVFT